MATIAQRLKGALRARPAEGVSVDHPLRMRYGEGAPRIVFALEAVLEDADAGDLAAALAIANSPDGVSWVITLGEGAPSEFALDEGDDTLLEVAEALNYETATFYDVPLVATSDEDPATVLTRTIRIPITNVIETPVNTVPPAVTGVAEVGEVVECSTGTWTDMQAGTFAYQWKDASDDSEIEGQTAATFAVTGEWVDESVYCTVTATNAADSAAEDSNTVGPFEFAPGYGADDGFLLFGEGALTGLHLGMI